MKEAKVIDKCLLCGSSTVEIMDFGSTPLANEFLTIPTKQDTFPLILHQCSECQNVQINCIVDADRLFKHYLYEAGTSSVNVQHFNDYADKMADRHKLTYEDLVIDIGSNDGTLLAAFKKKGYQTLGVDPAANLVADANKKGIRTVEGFFTTKLAKELLPKCGKATLLTANNIFAHAEDLHEIIEAVKLMLTPTGTFVFEVSSFAAMVKNKLFDLVYHEHLFHHQVAPLIKFMSKHGMTLTDVEKIPNHGGSLRISCCRSNLGRETYQLKEEDIVTGKMIKAFGKDVLDLKGQLTSMLHEIHQSGKKISIYGFPAKATLLWNYFKINPLWVSSVYDDAALKQGRWIPGGTHIVKDPIGLYKENPDYVLILGWNFADSIIKNHLNFNGKWIIPLPNLEIKRT